MSQFAEALATVTPSGSDDRTTEYTYDGAGHVLTLTAREVGGTTYQRTQFVYGVSPTSGSTIASFDLLKETIYPDKSSGDPSTQPSDKESYKYNALGEVKERTDRNQSTHSYSFDVLGRQTADAVTTLGPGVNGAVRRLETAYDTAGRPFRFTSFDAPGGGNVVNQVERVYNGLGQLITEYQSHAGAVNPMSTPKVQYAYSAMAGGANHRRLTGITYPNGRVVNSNYAGLDNTISRLTALSDTSATLERYTYLGLDTVVERAHPQPNVNLTYLISGSSDGGDQYVGLDRFGRVVEQRWDKAGSATDRFQYSYDRDSNRLTKTLPLQPSKNETYGYDNLNQLTSFSQGATHTQNWTLDALGNWSTFTNDGVPQTRTHNKQNQVTAVGGNTLTFDNNGNTLTVVISSPVPENHAYAYDAWNRLVQATDNLTSTTATFAYDALDRRLSQTTGGTTTDLYYSDQWQVLEERISGAAKAQYVWSPVYVDALVERDRDANGQSGDGPRMDGLEERLYAQQDANWNVTALVDSSGNVIERYIYDPYGAATLLTAGWGTSGSTQYVWAYLFQGTRWENVSALYDLRNRQLSPTLGRPVQRDPSEFTAGDPSLYRYVSNNPMNLTDPSGLQAEVRAGEVIRSGKIADLDAEYKNTPFKDLAAFARKRIADTYSKQFKDWNIELPNELTQAGPLTLINKEISEKNFKLAAGSYTAAFNLFFVKFDICDPKDELGIRVTEYTNRIYGDKDLGTKGPTVFTPKVGNAWTVGIKKKPDGKFDKSIIYVDSPGTLNLSKLVKAGEAGNKEDQVPLDTKLSIVQFVEIINTKTTARVAHKLMVLKVNIDKAGKVDSSFLGESDPAYKALDSDFSK
jgi:RHS repeat-associated protein